MKRAESRPLRTRVGRVLPALAAAAALVSLVGACGGDSGDEQVLDGRSGYSRSPAPEVGDLTLIDFSDDSDGEMFALKPDSDDLLLFYFGYLSCPDVCPLSMSDASRAISELETGDQDRVRVAMLTVDPDRDEGVEIAAYLDHFFDDHHALRASTEEQLDQIGERFSATWSRERVENGNDPDAYFMSHTASLYVIDDEGRVVWEFPFGTEPVDMAFALDDILHEST